MLQAAPENDMSHNFRHSQPMLIYAYRLSNFPHVLAISTIGRRGMSSTIVTLGVIVLIAVALIRRPSHKTKQKTSESAAQTTKVALHRADGHGS